MSRNKGKDGEMRLTRLVCDIGITEDDWDFTRPTTTNESDLGGDLFIRSSAAALARVVTPVSERPEYSGRGALQNLGSKPVLTRVDNKNEDGKLQKDAVEKFVGDVAKNPMCTVHMLAGGKALTGPAHKAFVRFSDELREDGKILVYLSRPAIEKLEEKYSETRPSELRGDDDGPAA